MTEGMSGLERLGRNLAECVGEGPGSSRMLAQRKALVSMMARRRRPVWLRLALPAAAAAALIVLLAWYARSSREEALGFRVGGSAPCSLGVKIESAGRPLPIDFDDGSWIEILGGSAGRLVESTSKQVVFHLDRGKVSASIKHRERAQWVIEAGAYRVTVMGTEFAVSWVPEEGSLDVSVVRGKVLVTGPGLDRTGKRLAQGQALHLPGMKGAEPPAPPQQAASQAAPAQPAVEGGGVPAAGSAAKPFQLAAPSPGGIQAWKALFNEGSYSAAVKAAEEEGFGHLLATLDQNDLWSLSDACRYARDGKRAEEALKAVRSRFPSSGHAKIAAFLLGRVSMELNKDPGEAALWFKIYLQEEPGAPLAEEALGRLIKAGLAGGRKGEAKEAAKTYIATYPDGVFAPLAQSALQQ